MSYYELGVNWASEKFKPKFDWATDDYNQTGYAELVDFLCTGLYFYEVTKEEVESKGMVDASKLTEPGMKPSKSVWYSVEGSAEIVKQVTMNAVPVYGSLYVEQYKGEPERFKKAKEKGGTIKFANVNPRVKKLFEITRTEKHFEFYGSVEDAEKSF